MRSHSILVTGATSYLGAVLVPRLLAAGHTITAVDDAISHSHGATVRAHPGLRIHNGDVSTIDRGVLDGVDTVIVLTDDADLGNKIDPVCPVVGAGTALPRLVRLAEESGVRRVIHSSTCAVYADSDTLTETSPTAPRSASARAALRTEHILTAADHPGFRTISLRLGNLYGVSPQMHFDPGIHAMTRDALLDGKIRIQGNGRQWRPLLHVADAADAFVECLDLHENRLPNPATFNVTGRNHWMRQVADIVAAGCDQAPVVFVDQTPELRDCLRVYCSQFTALTGWFPERTVADAVAEIRAWLANPANADKILDSAAR
ncbi:NAD-dependent epimerase/dehydratase family protein [Nocardia goodfellowii]